MIMGSTEGRRDHQETLLTEHTLQDPMALKKNIHRFPHLPRRLPQQPRLKVKRQLTHSVRTRLHWTLRRRY